MYGNSYAEVEIAPVKSIGKGDACNVSRFAMENHWGTHLDCPAHFFPHGRGVADYAAGDWFFSYPHVVLAELTENQLIGPDAIGAVPAGTDLLLIRSGFSRFRGTEAYSCRNPGFRPETGIWLREKHPSVRCVGFDFVSLSPYQHREVGREAHRAFLDPDGPNSPILIIEDMDLSGDLSGLDSVWVVPLLLEGLDSAPCTVMGVCQ